MSLPASIPVRPAASAAAEPPDEPPGESATGPRGCWWCRRFVVALPVGQHQRHVGLAEQHHAGVEQPIHGQGVAGGDAVAQRADAPGGGQAGDVEALLDGHRHAEQGRAAVVAMSPGRGRAFAGAVEVAHDDGVDARIEAFDAGYVVVEQFAGSRSRGRGVRRRGVWRRGRSGPCAISSPAKRERKGEGAACRPDHPHPRRFASSTPGSSPGAGSLPRSGRGFRTNQAIDELKVPPSRIRLCPTMNPIFAEHRNAQASPNSAGSPTRPAGEFFARS